jgi:hypothetical protein
MCYNPTCMTGKPHPKRPAKPGYGGHLFYACVEPCDNPGACQWCDGGLWLCTVCGGFEGTLPSECPKQKMTEAQEDAIYKTGTLDFKGGKWIDVVPKS